MKKIIIFGISIVCVINVCIMSAENHYLRFRDKLEALANNCENPVETKSGMGYVRNCYNTDGSSYTSFCCDPDPNYKDSCQGRGCGNSPKF